MVSSLIYFGATILNCRATKGDHCDRSFTSATFQSSQQGVIIKNDSEGTKNEKISYPKKNI